MIIGVMANKIILGHTGFLKIFTISITLILITYKYNLRSLNITSYLTVIPM